MTRLTDEEKAQTLARHRRLKYETNRSGGAGHDWHGLSHLQQRHRQAQVNRWLMRSIRMCGWASHMWMMERKGYLMAVFRRHEWLFWNNPTYQQPPADIPQEFYGTDYNNNQ